MAHAHTQSRVGGFHMADVRHKRPTLRRAVAVGELSAGPDAFAAIAERRLPKGDAMAMAEVAGLQGATESRTGVEMEALAGASEQADYRPQSTPRLDGWRAAVITLSDRACRGEYEDRSGPVLIHALRELGAQIDTTEIMTDESEPLIAGGGHP